MARRGRGGRRTGSPGQAYANRSDLTQAPTAAPAREYGDRKRQIEAQEAVPLPQAPPTPAPGQAPMNRQVDLSALPAVGGMSNRPDEPVTTGIPSGPGAGPEALASAAPGLLQEQLRALYRLFPNDDLARLVDRSAPF